MTNVDIVRKAQSEFLKEGRPDMKTGMEVEVYQIIKEGNKERIQRFKGIVIKVAGKSELEKTITVRRKVGAFEEIKKDNATLNTPKPLPKVEISEAKVEAPKTKATETPVEAKTEEK